ncbi:MAG: hypothetical protein MJH10_09595 [Epibacterium sp.]|nr:hypothetical protein [Epibacterium sp.]NQX73788.1 hypothetical protein [Epibacterium sp.]
MENVSKANEREVSLMKAELGDKYLTPAQTAELVEEWSEHYVAKLMRESKLKYIRPMKSCRLTTYSWVQDYLKSVVVEPIEQKGYVRNRTLEEVEEMS